MDLLARLYQYQKERFPLIAHGLLITMFSFSAISFSRLSRGYSTFIDGTAFIVCLVNATGIFLLLRISDEFKDHEDDKKYRKYLPVIRGLVSLKELKWLGIIVFSGLVLLNILFDFRLFLVFLPIVAYLFLMRVEFFVPKWLKAHHFWYVVSHMMIIPIVDIYASSFDWMLSGSTAPATLRLFFAVSFLNGIVLEIGRKIRVPETEEPGVLSYTNLLGGKRAVLLWWAVLISSALIAFYSMNLLGHGLLEYSMLSGALLICSIPAILYLIKAQARLSKWIELSAFLWTLILYLSLGGISMFINLIKSGL